MTARIPMILSATALAVSLTGVGGVYAAGLVNGSTIMNHTIGIGKLTPKAVHQLQGHRGVDGANGTDGVDSMDGVGIQGPAGLQGVPGIQGVAGLNGATGAKGLIDLSKVSYWQGSVVTIWPGLSDAIRVECPAGNKVLGGGFDTSSVNQVGTSGPTSFSDGGYGWSAIVCNDETNGSNITAAAYAVCVAP
jgi:hypothetical protein